MTVLLVGLAIFLASHSVRIFADDWRTEQIGRIGEWPWKGAVGLVSAIGFALLVWGFALARATPIELFTPPAWIRPVTILLTVPVFPLVAAAYVPGNALKRAFGHPMVLGVIFWALAHLPASGHAADVALFGGLLVWAVADYAGARRRDRRAGIGHAGGTAVGNAVVVAGGLIAWWGFARFLHPLLIGVAPFGPS